VRQAENGGDSKKSDDGDIFLKKAPERIQSPRSTRRRIAARVTYCHEACYRIRRHLLLEEQGG
jgi:hypothetical protein